MKLKFNPSLDYQQEAISSTLELFEGITATGNAYVERGIANDLSLDHARLLSNLHHIQECSFMGV